ncbi:MAG TPA: SpoIIE family protein phosphatase [Firmicutes bacterium]|nr:SpoIIE family protein phosphatase [Bacillota bacterium]
MKPDYIAIHSVENSMDGLQKQPSALLRLARSASVFLSAILLSHTQMLSSFSPFGVAWTMVLPPGLSYLSLVGSLIGYVIFGNIRENLLYLTALLLTAAFKLILYPRVKVSKTGMAPAVFCAGIFLVSGLAIGIAGGMTTAALLLIAAESLLAGGVTFFFGQAVQIWHQAKNPEDWTMAEQAGMAVSGLILLMALCSLEIGIFNIGKLAAVLVVLIYMYQTGAAGGAAAGTLCSIALALYSPSFALPAGLLAASAALGGTFRPVGRFIQMLVFVCSYISGILVLGPELVPLSSMLEILVGMVLFILLPDRVLLKVPTSADKTVGTTVQYKDALSQKLAFSARALLDIHSSVKDASQKLSKISSNDISGIYHRTADCVCKQCGLNTFCWITAYQETMHSLNHITHTLRANGMVTEDTLPAHLQQKCCKKSAFLASINQGYKEYLAAESASRAAKEARMVTIEQFEGMADMLTTLGREMGEIRNYDEEKAEKAADLLMTAGCPAPKVYAVTDRYGRLGIEAYLDKPPRCDLQLLSSQLSDRLQREFDLPSCTTAGTKTKLAFFERANLCVDFSACQLAEDNNKLCGDSYEYFLDSKGYAHLVLSDGMGSGGRAAVDSAMTCSLMSKLLRSGFGYAAALKLVNSSFQVKSPDETFATLDIASIDLYTGETEFLKAGAAVSFVYKKNSFIRIDGSSLPVGILQGIEFFRRKIQLNSGDILVLVSDGVTATGLDWIEADIQLYQEKNAQEIADRLCREAKRRRVDGHSDDITVMVAKIEKGI